MKQAIVTPSIPTKNTFLLEPYFVNLIFSQTNTFYDENDAFSIQICADCEDVEKTDWQLLFCDFSNGAWDEFPFYQADGQCHSDWNIVECSLLDDYPDSESIRIGFFLETSGDSWFALDDIIGYSFPLGDPYGTGKHTGGRAWACSVSPSKNPDGPDVALLVLLIGAACVLFARRSRK